MDEKVFDTSLHMVCFQILRGYLKSYGTIPKSPINLIEYFTREAKAKALEEALVVQVTRQLEILYTKFDEDTQLIKDTIVRFAKSKMSKDVIKEFGGKLNDLSEAGPFDGFERGMRKVFRVSSDNASDGRGGSFFIADRKKNYDRDISGDVIRTKFPAMNKVMAEKGFLAPEVIVIMAGPKAGKTTLLVNLAVGFIRNGLKVYYCDTENGERRIRTMTKQCILNCTFDEMKSEEMEGTFNSMMKNYELLGGEMMIDFYPPDRHSTADVRDRLKELEEDHNFIPDVIICDYFDKMKPEDKSIKEKRLQLQAVYMDWKVLNNEFNVPTFTVSQVNKQAVEKDVFNIGDIAEDFGKVANADSVWAYCSTPEEKMLGIYRLIPIANRNGKDATNSHVSVDIKVDFNKVSVEQDGEEY